MLQPDTVQAPQPADSSSISEPGAMPPLKARYAISSPYLHAMQRRHFFRYDVLPFLGTIGAIGLAFYLPPTRFDFGLLVVMWVLTGLGLSVGFHRLFSHRAFKTTTPIRVVLAVCGCMAARSSMTTWATQHRRHHQIADHPGDVHSPNLHGAGFGGRLRGWWYSHVSWMLEHEYPNIAYYGRDLIADKAVAAVDRQYQFWILFGLALPAVLGGLITQSLIGAFTGFLWGGVVRLFLVAQQVSALNSLNHMFGTRPFKMRDNNARNILLFGLITWGEGWHNNHHALPSSARFGFHWYQIDPGYWLIRLLELLGLAWDVRRPTAEHVRQLYRKYEGELSSGTATPQTLAPPRFAANQEA